jgi:hypothetical protein
MARFWLGLIFLLLAAVFAFSAVGVGLSSIIPGAPRLSPILPMILVVAFLCAAFGVWSAELRATEGDDLFTGRRGLLVAMMVIASITVFALTVVSLFNRDAWRGFLDGVRG